VHPAAATCACTCFGWLLLLLLLLLLCLCQQLPECAGHLLVVLKVTEELAAAGDHGLWW
jgi:hypothetical protein